ncbi:MAG: hypothetical protein M3454_15585 [Actinomycetota bacterium]|nr:hypothetical protein [Actinomycetota bacterium]
MIEIAIVVVVALAILLWVGRPMLSGARIARRSPVVPPAADRKASALTAIVDLEEERALGKLAPPDFESLRATYEAEALAALRELTTFAAAPQPSDEELEAEIAEIRAALACPRCGRTLSAARTCSQCGA